MSWMCCTRAGSVVRCVTQHMSPVPLQTRQAGYTALQETLWQRSQQRAAARSDPSSRAAFNKSLMEHLELTQGKLTPGWIPG